MNARAKTSYAEKLRNIKLNRGSAEGIKFDEIIKPNIETKPNWKMGMLWAFIGMVSLEVATLSTGIVFTFFFILLGVVSIQMAIDEFDYRTRNQR